MSEICFIGSGGSVATRNRDNTSFVLQGHDRLILIDCPGSVVQKLKKMGFDPRTLDALMITHIHPDHIYGLPSLIHSMMLDECLIKIYGSGRSMKFCADLLDLFGLRGDKIKCRVELVPVDSEQRIRIGESLTCAFFEVPHSPSSMASHFYLESEKMEVVYSGDTPACRPLFNRIKNVDVLVHDCSAPSRFFKKYPELSAMHTDALTLGRLSQQAGIRHLIPCHFFGELNFSLEEVEEEIRKHFQGDLTIPQDFSRISLSGAG